MLQSVQYEGEEKKRRGEEEEKQLLQSEDKEGRY